MRGARWLRGGTLVLVAAVLAVNLLGVWEIAVALRSAREQRRERLALRTDGLARELEGRLAAAAADVAFLLQAAPMREARATGRFEELGAALILFLRGYPFVEGMTVRHGSQTVLEAGRPRGVPGYWHPEEQPRPAPAEPGPRLTRRFTAQDADLAVTLSLAGLLRALEGGTGQCAIVAAGASDLDSSLSALDTGTWGGDPWAVRCGGEGADGSLEPAVARQRTLVAVNVAVMLLAAVLGAFAFRETSRRRQLEQDAEEEQRIRELERQLFHAERLGTAGRLAAGIAHEINNPLEGMANYLALARDGLSRGDTAAAARHVERAGDGLERAAAIVRRVLDHADPSAPVEEDLPIEPVIEQSLEFVRSRSEFSHIDFRTELPESGTRVRGSQVTLGQVFLNLVLNACEAQTGGGEVFLTVRRDGAHVDCEVADRGPGIPSHLRERIFEPFESTKQSAGLGLSICHSIVRRHGGELTVRDREGGGAVFRVRLRSSD